MAVIDFPQVQELENIKSMIVKLQAEEKAKRNVIKELDGSIAIAKLTTANRIKEIEVAFDVRKQELDRLLAPLESLKHQIAVHTADLAKVKSEYRDQTAKLRHERHEQLSAIAQQITHASERLDKIVKSIEEFKAKVASL